MTANVTAAGLTVMPVWLPAMLPMAVSAAVIDCVPAVFSVALKVCMPASPVVKV